MDRILRIVNRMFELHGTTFIAAAVAITVLLVLVVMMRRRRAAQNADTAPASLEIGDAAEQDEMQDDIELSMIDDPSAGMASGETGKMDAMEFEVDATTPDQLDDAAAHQFDIDEDVMSDVDDITIPKVGEAPPPRKPGFFSASWLHRDKKQPAEFAAPDAPPPDARTRDAAAECARLAEIERNMLALRELYEAGLIAPEVYVLKAREFAQSV
ncbi:MAG: hypothetical protein ACR2OK_06110 [Parvibaculales bacterium]